MGNVIKPRETGRSSVSSYEHSALDELLDPDRAAFTDPSAVLAEAREEAEEKVREAYAEGMRRGMEAGEKKFLEGVGESAELLDRTAEALQKARDEFIETLEPQLVQLAASIASKILDREASTSGDLIQRTVRSVLSRVMDEERVEIRANPRDLESLREHRIKLLEEFERVNRIDLIADDSIEPGGCVAITDGLRIDGRLMSQLEQIINELMD